MRVLLGDLIFNGSGNRDFARLEENIARGHFRAAAGKNPGAVFLGVDPVDDLGNVKAFFVIEAAADISETDDLVARFCMSCAASEPTLPNPWTTTRHPSFFMPSLASALSQQIMTPRPVASRRPAEPPSSIGLPGLQQCGFADVHGVGVHHPSHGLLVRADVRSGDVALWAQPIGEFGGVAACKSFQLAAR